MKAAVRRVTPPSAQRSATPWQQFLIGAVNGESLEVPGYTRLVDSPDFLAAVGKLADILSNATIQLFENGKNGDKRLRNELSRFIDISPYRYGSRKDWMEWIILQMFSTRDGTAYVLPQTRDGLLVNLEPMPGAYALATNDGMDYVVQWRDRTYSPDEVLRFPLRPNPSQPWRGQGVMVALRDVTHSLRQTSATKKGFMSDKFKPSVIVRVNALSEELDDPEKRQKLVDEYFANQQTGAPWIIPSELMEVQQVKPLSLTDLAISDSVELDKRAIASMVGVTPYMLGVGAFDANAHNNMIKTTVLSIANTITQELTKKLLYKSEWYFKISTRRLYAYSLKELADISTNLYVRGIMTGNEVRDWLDMSPVKGLDERVILENYIPAGMIGDQKKLQGGDNNAE